MSLKKQVQSYSLLSESEQNNFSSKMSISATPQKIGNPYLLLKCGVENIAFEMSSIAEVSRVRFVHRLPHKSEGVAFGLVNINGELLIAINIYKLLGIDDCGVAYSIPRMIVCRNGEDKFVFKVDKVDGLASIDDSELLLNNKDDKKVLGKFSEKYFIYNQSRYNVVDFELFIHAIKRHHL